MKQLFRSRTNKVLSGLCGGIAERFGMDATIVRLLVAFAACISFGTVFFVYLIASLVIPKAPYDVIGYASPYQRY